jgi:enediyne biosynthesis protein E4
MSQPGGAETRGRSGPGLWLGLLGAGALLAGIGLGVRPLLRRGSPAAQPARPAPPAPAPARVESLLRQREELDKTVWADEVLAQDYEDTFVKLWDDLRAASDKAAVLAEFPFDTLIVGRPQGAEVGELGIRTTTIGGEGRSLDRDGWRDLLGRLAGEGFELVESEWHHARFEPRRPEGARSTVAMLLHVRNRRTQASAIVRGDLLVDWRSPKQGERLAVPRIIDARNLKVLEREGPPVFQEAFRAATKAAGREPDGKVLLTLYDLDGDGRSEILVPTTNQLWWNRGDFRFEPAEFLAHFPEEPKPGLRAGVLADFDGDGVADFLAAGGELLLYKGGPGGTFAEAPARIKAVPRLSSPSVLTAGDIDGDGDLDVWLTQYLEPYRDGQMPTPFYDANDGLPSYLLRNDGRGRFRDVTTAAGLAPKRQRRTFSASFVDLDGDGDLDLLTVNDFSGLDLHLNDGKGRFTEATDRLVDQRRAFGMSHTFGDYDRDGRLDFYMIGMGSTTARRLSQLGLKREDAPDVTQMRFPMGYGNRMYLARPQGGYAQAPFNDQVARTGWAWGATTFDLDNDGDRDVFVSNGNVSGTTSKDYCSRYWTHDIYTGDSSPDPVRAQYFSLLIRNEMSRMSWNGFEHDCLLLNRGGRGFSSVGFLMGVGFEFDSRNAASDDLDGDGRVDLLVVEKTPDGAPVLHVLKNTCDNDNHWIGVRLREHGPGRSPIGATVTVEAGPVPHVARLMVGDSYKTQHAPAAHFGLGAADRVEAIEVRWPDGTVSRRSSPAADRYHSIDP